MQTNISEVFIGIGSNVGHRFSHIRKALWLLEKILTRMRISAIAETEAIVPQGAPSAWDCPYFNLVVIGNTTLSPLGLLRQLQEIEKELGRDHCAPKWAPRTIDLDILAWNEQVIEEEFLTIPHKELGNRSFLIPLMASLKPSWRHPASQSTYSRLTLSEILHFQICDSKRIKYYTPFPHLVGIVNITPDSFSDGGAYLYAEKAVQRIEELTAQGAAVIEIGAQSTRPGAVCISKQQEWERLEPVLAFLSQDFASRIAKPQISLDSYRPEIVEKALRYYPIDWINDIQGGQNSRLIHMAVENQCRMVLNHSLTIPPCGENILSFDSDPMQFLYEWAEKTIEQFCTLGIDKEKIILDPGIGFGKSALQSFSILRDINRFKKLGCEVFVGHSRKSFLGLFFPTSPRERDLETLGISYHLWKERIDYLRVHNVEVHQKAFTATALAGGGLEL